MERRRPFNPRREVELTTRQSKRDSKSRGDEDEETGGWREGNKNKETRRNCVRVIVRRRGSSSGRGERKWCVR